MLQYLKYYGAGCCSIGCVDFARTASQLTVLRSARLLACLRIVPGQLAACDEHLQVWSLGPAVVKVVIQAASLSVKRRLHSLCACGLHYHEMQ